MHRGIGAAKYVVDIDEDDDDRPITTRALEQLRVAFGVGRTKLADVPLGIFIYGALDEQHVEVIRAVAGCSHLSLLAVTSVEVPRQLCDALAMHQSLTHLHLMQLPSVLCDLMPIVSVTCKQLVSLKLNQNCSWTPSDAQTSLMLRCIAVLEKLQCLVFTCHVIKASPADLAAVLRLPKLKHLQLVDVMFDRAAIATIFGVLARRPRPLRAFLLHTPKFSGKDSVSELFSPTGLKVLRQLYWFEYFDLFNDTAVMDAFIDTALPVMIKLQRLAIHLDRMDEPAIAQRVQTAAPRQQQQFSSLTIGRKTWPARDVKLSSLQSLVAVLRSLPPGKEVLPSIQQKLKQVTALDVSSSWPEANVLSVCRDFLPYLSHLSRLELGDGVTLTGALADVLHDVLPCIPSLKEVSVHVDPQQRHRLRRVFSHVRPYSLLYVQLRCHHVIKCVVPIQAMRAALSVSVFPDVVRRLLPSGRYYRHPDHADRPWPCAVPSLLDLCASFVLTGFPPDHDLSQLPEALSRHSLREQLMPCDECGTYRRLADGFISVRDRPWCVVEVLRCFSCYVRSPGEPSPFDVE